MRPKRATDEIEDFDLGFDPSVGAAKLPTDITGGMEAMRDFMKIPCEKLVPYQSKQGADFKPLSDEKFQILLQSVREKGVLEPVIVRPLKGDKERFELLAGEHRWRASQEAGLPVIPAHVLRRCDDRTAADIFAVTNLVRRENTLRDKVNGWWHYTQAVHYKRGGQIQEMLDAGLLSPEVHAQAKSSMRQVYRYANLHRLIPPLLDMADGKQLSIAAAEQLSYLEEGQQRDLLDYRPYLNSPAKCKALRTLGQTSEAWSIPAIEEIMLPKEKESSALQAVTRSIRETIRRRLKRENYPMALSALESALDALIREHPEYGKEETGQPS